MMESKNQVAYRSIAWIVKSALNRKGLYSDKNMLRYCAIAAEYYGEQFNTFIMATPEVAYLNYSGTRTVKLPEDYVDFISVGVNLNGEIWTLGRNKNLAKQNKEECGIKVNDLGVPGSLPFTGYQISDHYHNGELVSGALTMGGGWNMAYFDIDTKQRLLVIDGNVPRGEVVLEYISSGVKGDGTTLVPHIAINAVRMFILWQIDEYDDKVNQYTKRNRERQFIEAENQAKWFADSMTMDEIKDIFYSSYHQGPKR